LLCEGWVRIFGRARPKAPVSICGSPSPQPSCPPRLKSLSLPPEIGRLAEVDGNRRKAQIPKMYIANHRSYRTDAILVAFRYLVLNERQLRFCAGVVSGLNGASAYLAAYLAPPRAMRRTAPPVFAPNRTSSTKSPNCALKFLQLHVSTHKTSLSTGGSSPASCARATPSLKMPTRDLRKNTAKADK
jgi:hypothetical protein